MVLIFGVKSLKVRPPIISASILNLPCCNCRAMSRAYQPSILLADHDDIKWLLQICCVLRDTIVKWNVVWRDASYVQPNSGSSTTINSYHYMHTYHGWGGSWHCGIDRRFFFSQSFSYPQQRFSTESAPSVVRCTILRPLHDSWCSQSISASSMTTDIDCLFLPPRGPSPILASMRVTVRPSWCDLEVQSIHASKEEKITL